MTDKTLLIAGRTLLWSMMVCGAALAFTYFFYGVKPTGVGLLLVAFYVYGTYDLLMSYLAQEQVRFWSQRHRITG